VELSVEERRVPVKKGIILSQSSATAVFIRITETGKRKKEQKVSLGGASAGLTWAKIRCKKQRERKTGVRQAEIKGKVRWSWES